MPSLSAIRQASVLLAILSLLACRDSQSFVEKGNALFDQGKFAEAALNYRKALQKDPTNGEAYYRLGMSELKENKPAAAFQDLSQAVRLRPDHQAAKSALENLALTAYLGDPQRPKILYDALVRMSDEWLKRDPQSPEGLRIKGYLAMVDRRPADAAELFRRAYQTNPRELKIALGLMDALFRNGQAAEAEKIGLDFIAADKTAADVYDALYRLYIATDQPGNAEKILIRKIHENPAKTAYLLELASHYARAHKKPEMEEALQRFLANQGSDSRVHLDAGDFYGAIGDWNSALQQYKLGQDANPKDALLYQNRIARSLISQNKREEALKILNQSIAQDPDDREVRALRAAVLVASPGSGKPGEGLTDFQALVDKNPDDNFLKFVFSKARLESGDLVGARAQLLEVIKRNPAFLEARNTLAEIAYRQGNMTEVVEQTGLALALDPYNFPAQLLRGTALLRLGNADEAGSVLNRLARQAPQSIDVQLQLASLDLQRRRFTQSEAAFTKILAANPNEWRALAGLVNNDLAQNRQEKAFSRLEEELKRSHGAPQVRYMMAAAALRGGKYSLAIESLRQLADQTSDSIDPQLELANVFRLRGDYRNAIATLQKAALLQPKDPRPAALMPFLLEMENRKQEAKVQARRALSMQPDDPESMNNLAFLIAETGDNLDEALRLARKAVTTAPDQPAFLDTLGYIYLKRDQNDDAVDVLSKLVQKYPDQPAFAYHLGMAWFQKGDPGKAKTMLSRALQHGPTKEIETGIHDLLSRIN